VARSLPRAAGGLTRTALDEPEERPGTATVAPGNPRGALEEELDALASPDRDMFGEADIVVCPELTIGTRTDYEGLVAFAHDVKRRPPRINEVNLTIDCAI
jgi:hypothetical protein